MARLEFVYGSVNCGKSTSLIILVDALRRHKKNVLVMKPMLDTRFGKGSINSRAGLGVNADILIEEGDIIRKKCNLEGVEYIVVDEVQFLDEEIIEQFREIVDELNITVRCYGLDKDFKSYLFDGSKRMFELCDHYEEINTICNEDGCTRKSKFSLKHCNGRPLFGGQRIQLGGEELFFAVCSPCYWKKKREYTNLENDPLNN